MKSYIYNKVEKVLKGLVPLMLLVLVPSLTACSDDEDSQSTTMTINKIYLETTDAEDENYDREDILEMCTPMYVGGTSKREAIASMKMEKAKTLLNTNRGEEDCE